MGIKYKMLSLLQQYGNNATQKNLKYLTMNNLTTIQKKNILANVMVNLVNDNKCILKYIGVDLNSINYAKLVANMLINSESINCGVIELLDPSNSFSKKVKKIQYS